MEMSKKYKVKHTSIMHNGKMYKEGSIIELTDENAKRLEDFVELVSESLIKKQEKKQGIKISVKTSAETKNNQTKTEDVQKENIASSGDNANDNQNI